MKKFTVDYFIKKFSKIPTNKWCVGSYSYNGSFCALGHCKEHLSVNNFSRESSALRTLISKNFNYSVLCINDGGNESKSRFKQKTPKGRILAALRAIKKMKKA